MVEIRSASFILRFGGAILTVGASFRPKVFLRICIDIKCKRKIMSIYFDKQEFALKVFVRFEKKKECFVKDDCE